MEALRRSVVCIRCGGAVGDGLCESCGASYPLTDGALDFRLEPARETRRSGSALSAVVGAVASHPRIYDVIQLAAGKNRVEPRVRAAVAAAAGRTVLDLGAGSGALAASLPRDASYVWLDADPMKLAGVGEPPALALLADATRIPLADASVDWVVSIAVTHHLDDDALEAMLAEACRVARERIVVLDALLTRRASGRLLWRLDRGASPRSAEALRTAVGRHVEIAEEQRFAVFHDYLLLAGPPRRDPHGSAVSS